MMMFGSVLVNWLSFEGDMKVWRLLVMEVLEISLDGRDVCVVEWGKKKQNFV